MIMKRDTTEFEELLNKTVVPSNVSIDDQIKAYSTLQETIKRIIPKRLFRYRNCNDMSFSAFDKDELWVSSADCMNDGYDTRVFVDMEKINQWRKELSDLALKRELLEQIGKMQSVNKPVGIDILEQLTSIPQEKYNELVDNAIKKLNDDIDYYSDKMASNIQKTMKICCFSETIESPYMWGLYADNESGFALEYDFSNTLNAEPKAYGKTRNSYIYPVIYSNKRYELPLSYAQFLIRYCSINTLLVTKGVYNTNPELAYYLSSGICPDVTVPTKAALYKSKEWEQEEEWRLFCTSNDDQDFQTSKHGACIKKPTGLYLGRRISSINEKMLKILAHEKGIPVYKMELDDRVPTYELKSIPITDEN